MSTITSIRVFSNGMVMVFDEHGQQMPEYQGAWNDVAEKIRRDKPPEVEVQGGLIWQQRLARKM